MSLDLCYEADTHADVALVGAVRFDTAASEVQVVRLVLAVSR